MVHENGELLSNEGFLLDNEAEAILAILKRTATHRFAYHPDLCSSAIYYIRKLTVHYSKGADLIFEIPRSALVRMAIQNFSKNPVISTVSGLVG